MLRISVVIFGLLAVFSSQAQARNQLLANCRSEDRNVQIYRNSSFGGDGKIHARFWGGGHNVDMNMCRDHATSIKRWHCAGGEGALSIQQSETGGQFHWWAFGEVNGLPFTAGPCEIY